MRELRAALVLVAFLTTSAPAVALSCMSAASWETRSANGAFVLTHTLDERRGTTLRLARASERHAPLWTLERASRHAWEGAVSNDGKHVVTREGCGWIELVVRNEKGEIAREVPAREVISIWELMHGLDLLLGQVDPDSTRIVVRIADEDGDASLDPTTRHIDLATGAVSPSPQEPRGFLPKLKCARPRKLRWEATPVGVIGTCAEKLEYDEHDSVTMWIFDSEGETLRLVEFGEMRDGHEVGRSWSADGTADRAGPCETVYDDAGKKLSERCGPGVTTPP